MIVVVYTFFQQRSSEGWQQLPRPGCWTAEAKGPRGNWTTAVAAAAAWQLESAQPQFAVHKQRFRPPLRQQHNQQNFLSSAATLSSTVATSTPARRTKVWAWRTVGLRAKCRVLPGRDAGPSERTNGRYTQMFAMRKVRAFGRHLWRATAV